MVYKQNHSPVKVFGFIIVATFFFYLVNTPRDYRKNLETRTYRRLLTSYDITANTFLPYEIIKNKRLYFGEQTMTAMRVIERRDIPHSVVLKNGRYLPAYPIMSSLIAVPVYFIPLSFGKIPNLDTIQRTLGVLILGRISASFYTALSVGIFYLILRRLSLLKKLKISFWFYLTIFFFAFCTNVYSISSRGLWQHVPALLFNSLILLVMLHLNDKDNLFKWLGVLCGLSFLSRPTNIFYVAAVAIFVLVKYRRVFIQFILGAVPFAIIYMLYNYLMFGSPFVNEYVARDDTHFTTPIWEGLIGYMVSPARSFLFITPPLVMSYYCLVFLYKKKGKDYADHVLQYLGTAFIATLIMYSMWWCWY